MKNRILLILLVVLFGTPVTVLATEDLFDQGQSRMTGSEAIFNMGFWALTHPGSLKSVTELGNENETKKEPDDLDKKVDEAIKKAWSEE